MAELGLLQLMSRKPGWDRFHLVKDICDDVGFLNTHMGLPLETMGETVPAKSISLSSVLVSILDKKSPTLGQTSTERGLRRPTPMQSLYLPYR